MTTRRTKNWVALSSLDIGIPKRTLRRWAHTGIIRAKKIGRKYYVHLPDLLKQRGFDVLADELLKRP